MDQTVNRPPQFHKNSFPEYVWELMMEQERFFAIISYIEVNCSMCHKAKTQKSRYCYGMKVQSLIRISRWRLTSFPWTPLQYFRQHTFLRKVCPQIEVLKPSYLSKRLVIKSRSGHKSTHTFQPGILCRLPGRR